MNSKTRRRLEEAEKIVRNSPHQTCEYIPSHRNGICEKTGRRYHTMRGPYKNTIGRLGAMSGWAGYERICSECGEVVGREVEATS